MCVLYEQVVTIYYNQKNVQMLLNYGIVITDNVNSDFTSNIF